MKTEHIKILWDHKLAISVIYTQHEHVTHAFLALLNMLVLIKNPRHK